MLENINILNELKEAEAVILLQADNRNYYAVPEEYFTSLASGVMANIFITSLPLVNPYIVPETYFYNLPNIILEKVNSSLLQQQAISKKDIYSIPNGYFNSFADDVLKKIKKQDNNVQQELEEISPFLSNIPRGNIYSLPENYFEQLNPLPGGNQNIQPAGKVISLGNKKSKWVNYAAAACISMLLFGGGYFFLADNKDNPVTAPVTASSSMDIQEELEGLSDSEIEAYLKENGNMAVFTNVGMDDVQHQNIDIQTLINDLPDEEIQQYLNDDKQAKTEEGI